MKRVTGKVSCPQCNATVYVYDHHTGRTIACSTCGHLVEVRRAEEGGKEAPPSGPVPSVSGRRHGLAWCFALLLLLASCILSAIALWVALDSRHTARNVASTVDRLQGLSHDISQRLSDLDAGIHAIDGQHRTSGQEPVEQSPVTSDGLGQGESATPATSSPDRQPATKVTTPERTAAQEEVPPHDQRDTAGINHSVQPVDRKVSLAKPYPASYAGAETSRISIQYAVKELARQAGLGYDFNASHANTDPVCRKFVTPHIESVALRDALEGILNREGLRYEIHDGLIVLKRQ